jgi:hypothetical protein
MANQYGTRAKKSASILVGGLTTAQEKNSLAYPSSRGMPKGPILSEEEIIVMRDVANRIVVQPSKCRRLKRLGFIEERLGSLILTPQGQIRLMFSSAR